MRNAIFERAGLENTVEQEVRAAKSYKDIESIFARLFSIVPAADPDEYKSAGSDYGLKVSGVKAREKINEQCREIIARVKEPSQLTDEERAVLLQYSGRGGLTENSQYEYYTPTHVAEGVWDALRENGFENGNVLDPCCGAGVFEGTKPSGVIVTANDVDPVGSGVARLLNPQDSVSTSPFERVVVNTPDDTFDSAIGNVPFGNARGASIYEDPEYKNEKVIERYFLLRILDKIKPGALACLVVPINIIGAKGRRWQEFRIKLSKKAEFLGAHKLPSKTFAKQGTDTVVDIIVLRKHSRALRKKIMESTIDDLRTANVVWDEFIEGRYWLGEGRRFIMGRYVPKVPNDRWSRELVDGDVDDLALKRKLAKKFHSRIDWEALALAEPVLHAYANGDRVKINGAMHEFLDGTWQKVIEQQGTTAIDKEKYGAESVEALRSILSSPKGGLALTAAQTFAVFKSFPDALSPAQSEAIQFAMSQPRTELCEQLYRGTLIGGMIARMGADADAGEDISQRRAELQELVTAEIQRFGHPKHNKGLILIGEGSRMFGMFKNAVDEKGNFSDLLAGTLDKSGSTLPYNPTDVSDIVTHLFVREGKEELFLEDIQALYKGEAGLSSLADLAAHENVAITPDGRIMPMNRYCAGNVFEKMAECAKAIAVSDDARLKAKFQEQIALMNKRRTVTAQEDIVFGFRQKWLSRKYVVQFLREVGYADIEFGSKQKVEDESYDGRVEIVEKFVPDYENPDGEFRGLIDEGFQKQFLSYLNGGKVTSNKADRKAAYIEQVNSLEAQFNVWMQQHPDIQDITDQFNRQFNAFVPVEYEGEPLGIDDCLSGEITPHGYQNAEVRRLAEQGSGICGFGVGLGKSFTALAMAAYNRKKGKAKRTCIVVPSAVLENWYHESRQFYKEDYLRANALFVGLEPKRDKDGAVQRKAVLDENGSPRLGKDGNPVMQDIVIFKSSKEDVHEVMWKIPQSNYSLVVMTKEKFASIPLRPSTKAAFTDKMVKRSLMSSKKADQIMAGKKSYADDKELSNLEAKFGNEGTKKKQELPYLEDMGFDSIIVDEAHYFKNSFEAGKESQGIAYLPTAPSANIAIDMAIKSDFIRGQNNGRGVYGLTATPVTNSPFEIFNMLSLVAPIEEFERFGVQTVDDFVRVFGNIEPVSKVMVSGEIHQVNGLVGFQNLDGLRNLFHKYTCIKTVKDVDNEIHVPEGVEHEESVSISAEQAQLYEILRKRAKEASKPGSKVSIFSVIRDMDRLTTDIDMFRHTMTFVFPLKYKDAVESLRSKLPKEIERSRIDQETGDEEKFMVGVEASINVGTDSITFVVPEDLEDEVLMHFPEYDITDSEIAHPITPKYAKMLENLRVHFEAKGKQLIFTEEKSQHQKIRRILVHHLPVTTDQIGIINAEDASGDKLDKISKAYNSGAIKIVIANKKAEVGVNLQKGTTAIHHLTLPWTPASINQRNGRGVRQGNKVESVALYYYCGKGTFDSYRKDLLQSKSNWINDLLTGEATSMKNGDVTGMDELLDMLADDPEQAKRQRAERLAAAEAKREENHRLNMVNKLQVLSSIMRSLSTIDTRKAERKAELEEQLATLERRCERYEQILNRVKDGTPEEIKEMEDKLAYAKRRISSVRAGLEGLDGKFEAERTKLENNKRMTAGILRQAGREGRLPFSEDLIDNPSNAVVSTKGDLFCVGDYLEFEEGDVWKVISVDSEARTIRVKKLDTTRDITTRIDTSKIKPFKKVSYSESELALKRVLAGSTPYNELLTCGIDKDTFLAHRNDMRIETWCGGIYIVGGKYVTVFGGNPKPANAEYAWPDPKNEDFKKAVCVAYLEFIRNGGRRMDAAVLMEPLFGNDFDSIAVAYGKTATEAEIQAIVAQQWEALLEREGAKTVSEKLELCKDTAYSPSRFVREISSDYDNMSDFERVTKDYLEGLHDTLYKLLQEERAAAERAAQEALKADPNYKEVPAAVAAQFRDIGMTVRTNAKEFRDSGFRGRGGTTYAPFSRWFIQDSNGVGGRLYKMKDILKARYSAKFTKDWSEFSGAWWHIASDLKLEDIYNLLA